MRNLFPVRRTDKNGRTQRRWIAWRRPAPRSDAIPSPGNPHVTVEWRDAAAQLMSAFSAGTTGESPRGVRSAIGNASMQFVPAEHLRLVADGLAPEAGRRIDGTFSGVWDSALRHVAQACLREGTAAYLNNLALSAEILQGSPVDLLERAHAAVFGLRAWGWAGQPVKDWSASDECDRRGGPALVWTALTLEGTGYVEGGEVGDHLALWLRQPLHDLILRRPDDAPKIAALLDDRGLGVEQASDVAYIEDLLDGGGAQALSDGAL